MSNFPGNSPMTIYQGDEYYNTFVLTTKNLDGTISPINLTGSNIDIQIRPTPGSSTLYAGTNNGTIVLLNRIDTSGQFDLMMTSTTTGAFTWTTGAYDIQVSTGTGVSFEATTYLAGTVSVTPRVTKIVY
jgi:hypothetical protein